MKKSDTKIKIFSTIIMGIIFYPLLIFIFLYLWNRIFFTFNSDCKFYLWQDINLKSVQISVLLIPVVLCLFVVNSNKNKSINISSKITLLIFTIISFITYKLNLMIRDNTAVTLLIVYIVVILLVVINDVLKQKIVKVINTISVIIILIFLLDSINMMFFLDSVKDIHTILTNDRTKIQKEKFDRIKKLDLHYSFLFEKDTVEITENNFRDYPGSFFNDDMINNITYKTNDEKYYAIWDELNIKFYPINKNSKYTYQLGLYESFSKIWIKYNLLQVYPDHLYKKNQESESLIPIEPNKDGI